MVQNCGVYFGKCISDLNAKFIKFIACKITKIIQNSIDEIEKIPYNC